MDRARRYFKFSREDEASWILAVHRVRVFAVQFLDSVLSLQLRSWAPGLGNDSSACHDAFVQHRVLHM